MCSICENRSFPYTCQINCKKGLMCSSKVISNAISSVFSEADWITIVNPPIKISTTIKSALHSMTQIGSSRLSIHQSDFNYYKVSPAFSDTDW